jgi:putative ABC transport system permease protein
VALFSLMDLRDAARGLRRAPAITVSGILCLALGLAVTTDVSSAVDRALLQPLPFRDPGQLLRIYRTTPHFDTGPTSAPNYEEIARATRALSAVSALTPSSVLVPLPSDALKLSAYNVSGNLFSMLGTPALRGRLLMPTDEAASAAPVAVLSEEAWRSRFGADASIVGRELTIDGQPRTVVGVLPHDFRVPLGVTVARADIWLPLSISPNQRSQRRSNYLMLIGRLAEGATTATASDELGRLFAGIVDANPELRGEGLRVVSLASEGVRNVRQPLLLMLGAVGIVLMIAATNVASLLLARGVHRRRETAIRAALGGERWSVMRPILAEALLLTAVGLTTGLFLAWAGLKTIGALAASRVPQVAGLTMDLRVIAFAVALSIIVAVVCGALPAWRSTGVDPQDALRSGRGGGADRTQHRLLGVLVIAEVGLSLVLLVAAGLVLKGFAGLLRQDPGFDAERMLTMQVSVSPARHQDGTAVSRFLEPAIAAIEQVPGVERAASISLLPYDNWGWNFNIRYEGQSGDDPTRLPLAENRVVTPGFFETTGQRLASGRLLTESDDDRPQSPLVVVVNQALVRRDFPGVDPIGKRFHRGDTTFATIVGVVSDIRNFGPFTDPRPEVYSTFRQQGGWTTFPVVVRSQGVDPVSLIAPVRAAIRGVDPEAAITRVLPMQEVIAESVGQPRFYLVLLGVFAVVAVLLAVAGVYGVLSYAVAQRSREFGIRSALGSTPRHLVTLVTGQGMRLVAIGLALGIAGSFGATRLLGSLLYGVSALDVPTWALSCVTLGLVGLLATLVPAVRSSRIEPVRVMRDD